MNKRILIDPKLLKRYMEFVAKGDVTPSVKSFLTYQEATLKILEAKKSEEKKSKIKFSEDKTVYRINVNERLDFNHTYTVELPSSVNDEDVWNKIDNCQGNGQIGDVNAVVSMFGGNILDVETDITPGVDIEIDEVEVLSNEK